MHADGCAAGIEAVKMLSREALTNQKLRSYSVVAIQGVHEVDQIRPFA